MRIGEQQYHRYGAPAWADCSCPACGAEPREFCRRLPWLARRLPRWIAGNAMWPFRWREHNERIVKWMMMNGQD